VLEVDGVSQAGVVKDISFEVGRGEVLGVFGLMGSGRTELARIVFGLDPSEQGTVTMNGVRLKGSPVDSIRNGLAFVTENRREEGLMMEATIADNLSIVALRDFARPPLQVVGQQRLRGEVDAVTSLLRVKGGDVQTQAAKSLSGGNQQKVVIGKWLMSKPRLFIMDEPTRGVDVGAKYDVYTIIHDLAAQGNGVIFISSEIEELIGMCDRILVLSHGEIRATFAKGSFDKASILDAAFEEQEVAA
jgi:ribose transport system ATP-binding protein